MVCSACGTALDPDARFCPQCGTPVVRDDVDTDAPDVEPDIAVLEADTEVIEPDTEVIDGEPEARGPEQVDPEPEPDPAPAPRTGDDERGVFDEFVATVVPLLRTPLVVATAVATLVATALSFAGAVVLSFLFLELPDDEPILLDAVADLSGGDELVPSFFSMLMLEHQVPLVVDDVLTSFAPLLLVVVPVLACVVGIEAARRARPRLLDAFPHAFVWSFAALYGVAMFVCSFFGPEQGVHRVQGAHLRAFLFAAAIALLAAWLHRRRVRRRADVATQQPAGGRLATIARRAASALAAGVLMSTVLGVVAYVLQALLEERDRARDALSSIVYALDTGVELFASGFFARGGFDLFGDDGGQFVWDRYDGFDVAPRILVVLTAFVPVVLAAIYSGFAIARGIRDAPRNDRLMFGALGTGITWSILLTTLLWVAQTRVVQDDDAYSMVSGVDTCFFSLVLGALLGLLGAWLAVHGGDRSGTDAPAR